MKCEAYFIGAKPISLGRNLRIAFNLELWAFSLNPSPFNLQPSPFTLHPSAFSFQPFYPWSCLWV